MKKKLLSLLLAVMTVMSFVVPASAAKPGVVTHEPKSIASTSVVMRGAVTSNSGIRIKEYGFIFVSDGNVSYKTFVSGKDFEYPDPINNDVIECKKTGLKAGKEYAYQFYAINENDEKTIGKTVYFTAKASSSNGDTKKPVINDFDCSEGSSFNVGQSVKFYADTEDNDKVAEVVLYIDGKVVKTSSDGYISYKTSELTVGKHTISVKVTDVSGNYTEEDMTVTVKGKEKLAAPVLKPKGSTIKVGEVLELSWNSVKNADYYTINVWATGFSQNYFDTSTEGYLKKITFDKPGTYAVSIYSRTNDHNAYEQSEPYGINITVVKGVCSHTPKRQNEKPRYDQVSSDTYHNMTMYFDSVCSECGEVLQSKSADKTEKENHSFSGDKCTKCGYTKKAAVCTHKNTTTSKKNIEKKASAISGNDTQHNVMEYYDVVCKCGVTIDYDVKGNTTKESHSFSGNTCKTCGYTKKAVVEETVSPQRLATPVVTIKKTTVEVGEKLNVSWNKVPNADYYTIHCWTTGKVYEKITGTSYNSISFDKSGTYSIAVYAQSKTPDKYPQSEPPYSTSITVTDGVCTHKNTTTSKKNIEKKASAISGNDTQHNVTEYYDVVCKCGVTISSDVKGDTTKASHSFSGNTCTACGYTKKVVEETNKSIFVDVSNNASYAEAVGNLSNKGIIEGYGNGEFRPNNTLTRAEAAVILCRLGGNFDVSPSTTKFSDVTQNFKWASGYIAKAVQMGIIAGMTDSTYEPQEKLTAAQFITMIVRWLGLENNAENRKGKEWYDGYTAVAEEIGLLDGINNRNYKRNISRADACVIADKALDLKGNVKVEERDKKEEKNEIEENISNGTAYTSKDNPRRSDGDRDGLSCALYAPFGNLTGISTHIDLTEIDTKLYSSSNPREDRDVDNAYAYLCLNSNGWNGDYGIIKRLDHSDWEIVTSEKDPSDENSRWMREDEKNTVTINEKYVYRSDNCFDNERGLFIKNSENIKDLQLDLHYNNGVVMYSLRLFDEDGISVEIYRNEIRCGDISNIYFGRVASVTNSQGNYAGNDNYIKVLSSSLKSKNREPLHYKNITFFNSYYYTQNGYFPLTIKSGELWIYPNKRFNNTNSKSGIVTTKTGTPIISCTEYEKGGITYNRIDIQNY